MTTDDTIRGTETDMATVRERYGGMDVPAALMGMFTSLGVLVFLGSLIAAGGGALEYQLNLFDLEGNATELTVVGIVTAAVVVLVAFFVGGIATGRMARYDGGKNGIGMALWTLLLVAIFAALGAFFGAEYNAFQQAGLPDWFSQFRLSSEEVTTLGIIAAAASIVAMFLGAYFGGRIGDLYHRRVDAALADRRAVTAPGTAASDRVVVDERVVADDGTVRDDETITEEGRV